jgi:hypothetical protein
MRIFVESILPASADRVRAALLRTEILRRVAAPVLRFHPAEARSLLAAWTGAPRRGCDRRETGPPPRDPSPPPSRTAFAALHEPDPHLTPSVGRGAAAPRKPRHRASPPLGSARDTLSGPAFVGSPVASPGALARSPRRGPPAPSPRLPRLDAVLQGHQAPAPAARAPASNRVTQFDSTPRILANPPCRMTQSWAGPRLLDTYSRWNPGCCP